MGGGNFKNKNFRESILTPELLAEFLGTSYKKIRYFYYQRNISGHYTSFNISKKSKEKRLIRAPSPQLKSLQKKLSLTLAQLYRPRSPVKGFVEGFSISDNAYEHARKKFVFNVDLKDFFHSITFPRVRGLLISEPYGISESVASVIAHLCTVDGVLPQGAPTSPLISNMICSRLDRELSSLARKHRAKYTRYADDITFSFYCPVEFLPHDIVVPRGSIEGFSHYGAKIGKAFSDIVTGNGFSINNSKVRLQGQYERQVVTGLTVNKKINIDRRFVRKTCALIHSMETYGLEQAAAKGRELRKDEDFNIEPHVQGRLLFIKQVQGVESPVYQRIARRFNALSSKYKVPLLPSFSSVKTGLSNAVALKCWVVEDYDTDSQGTAFMLESQLLVTCAHVVGTSQDDHLSSVEVFRANKRTEKYIAKVVHFDWHRDIALLKLESDAIALPFLRLENVLLATVDNEVSIWGFPSYKSSSPHVSRVWALITNTYIASTVRYFVVDKVLYSGNSGGPVLNNAEQVVGVAARGAVNGTQTNSFICVSELEKVLLEYGKIL
ncbi:trypsin-like peptidase domain-containing protein [Pseudomonas sp.]|uniref:trypsin-like peptidase domain-containing protein n=1 Tax=Pseudomonas sp. TaxID=306 RepID=UPI003A973F05